MILSFHFNGLGASKVLHKAERLSLVRVIQIMLIGISLLFETDILISFVETKIKETSHQPFSDVNQIEREYQQL